MDIKRKTGLAIGAAVIGAGAVFSVTYALSGSSSGARAQPTTRAGDGTARPGGGGAAKDREMGNLASALAQKLGVDEAKVSEAIKSAGQAYRPSGRSSIGSRPSDQVSLAARPSQDGFRSGMDGNLARAIAETLGIDETMVTKALAEVRAEQQASRPSGGNGQAPQPSASPTG